MANDSTGGWFHWAYEGVDHSLAGNGGNDCMEYIPLNQKVIESVAFVLIGLLEICYAVSRIVVRKTEEVGKGFIQESAGRNILLAAFCLIFGIELGFKLVSRQMIWVLNPCHIVTILQIYLLCASPSWQTTVVFRIQMHCLNGATVAILLPILNTRLLPFETHIYYIQHVMLLVVPFYLLRLGGPYTVERFRDFNWVLLTLGIMFVYHWGPLQLLAMASKVNLNNIMCPAVSDPFRGIWYRVWAAAHQTLLVSVHGKLYIYICSLILGRSLTEDDLQSPQNSECYQVSRESTVSSSNISNHCSSAKDHGSHMKDDSKAGVLCASGISMPCQGVKDHGSTIIPCASVANKPYPDLKDYTLASDLTKHCHIPSDHESSFLFSSDCSKTYVKDHGSQMSNRNGSNVSVFGQMIPARESKDGLLSNGHTKLD